MERRSAGEERISGQKGGGCIENIILEILIKLTVKIVGPGLGCSFHMRPAGRAHRSVVHRGGDVNLLNSLNRGRRQGLADRVEYRAVGLYLSSYSKDFTSVQRKAAGGYVAT